jgi:hypothetical protein
MRLDRLGAHMALWALTCLIQGEKCEDAMVLVTVLRY